LRAFFAATAFTAASARFGFTAPNNSSAVMSQWATAWMQLGRGLQASFARVSRAALRQRLASIDMYQCHPSPPAYRELVGITTKDEFIMAPITSPLSREVLGGRSIPVKPRFPPPKVRWFSTVNFDDVVSGTAIAANQYAGVTFSTVAPAGRPVYAATWPQAAKSAPNLVTLTPPNVLPAFDARDGAIKAQFSSLQLSVSIDALPLVTPETLGQKVTNQPFLEAFGDNDVFLGKVLYPLAEGSPGYGSWQTLTISSPTANIRYVLFSCQHTSGPAVYGMFDNLYFQVGLWDLRSKP
jgi:hypothetical protein